MLSILPAQVFWATTGPNLLPYLALVDVFPMTRLEEPAAVLLPGSFTNTSLCCAAAPSAHCPPSSCSTFSPSCTSVWVLMPTSDTPLGPSPQDLPAPAISVPSLLFPLGCNTACFSGPREVLLQILIPILRLGQSCRNRINDGSRRSQRNGGISVKVQIRKGARHARWEFDMRIGPPPEMKRPRRPTVTKSGSRAGYTRRRLERTHGGDFESTHGKRFFHLFSRALSFLLSLLFLCFLLSVSSPLAFSSLSSHVFSLSNNDNDHSSSRLSLYTRL